MKYRNLTNLALGLTLSGLLSACATQNAALPTQSGVNLEQYSGVWYEQALLPNRFQKVCVADVKAEYTVVDIEQITVVNECKKADGSMSVAQGVGRLNDAVLPPDPAKLEVRFGPSWLAWLPMLWGDYWILKTAEDYQYSLVGSPSREYLWVLSRDKKADREVVNELLEYAGSLGFHIDEVKYSNQ